MNIVGKCFSLSIMKTFRYKTIIEQELNLAPLTFLQIFNGLIRHWLNKIYKYAKAHWCDLTLHRKTHHIDHSKFKYIFYIRNNTSKKTHKIRISKGSISRKYFVHASNLPR